MQDTHSSGRGSRKWDSEESLRGRGEAGKTAGREGFSCSPPERGDMIQRASQQGLKRNLQHWGLAGTTEVVPCYKACRAFFQQAVKSWPVTKLGAVNFATDH